MKILLGADSHCGHLLGLTPPDYNPDSESHPGTETRKALWKFYEKGVRDYGPWDVVGWDGDAIDGKGFRSGGTELITADRNTQCGMAARGIELAKAPKVLMTYGTGYHTGQDDDWEDHVADAVKAERIEAEGHYDIRGVKVNMRHHIGGTSSVASRFTALSKESVRNLLWAEHDQQPKADLIVRAHVHVPRVCGEPGDWMAITLPGLQGLGSKYGARRAPGLLVRFGFAMLEVDKKGNWDLGWHIAPLKMQAATVTKL